MADGEDDLGYFGWVARARPTAEGAVDPAPEPAHAPMVPPPPAAPAIGSESATAGSNRPLFTAGLIALSLIAVLSAAVGFRLNTGGLDAEVTAPLQVASTVPGPIERPPTDVGPAVGRGGTSMPSIPVRSGTGLSTTSVPGSGTTSIPAAPESMPSSSVQARSRYRPGGGGSRPPTPTPTPSPTPTSALATTGLPSGSAPVPSPGGSTPAPVPVPPAPPSAALAEERPVTTIEADAPGPAPDRVPPPAPVVPVESVSLDAGGRLSVRGVVNTMTGKPAAGVKVDLFLADRRGKRDRFLTSVRTGTGGWYRFGADLDRSAGTGPLCVVLVFIAPEGLTFEETGRFREAVLCPDDPGTLPPAVRVLTADAMGPNGSLARVRSVIFGADKLFLRGMVPSAEAEALLTSRYGDAVGGKAVVGEYRLLPGIGGQPARNMERVMLDGLSVPAFELGTATIGPSAARLTELLARVLVAHPETRLDVVIAVDPNLAETRSAALGQARAGAVVELLAELGVDRAAISPRVIDRRTRGRRLAGRSINSQLEFTLRWPPAPQVTP